MWFLFRSHLVDKPLGTSRSLMMSQCFFFKKKNITSRALFHLAVGGIFFLGVAFLPCITLAMLCCGAWFLRSDYVCFTTTHRIKKELSICQSLLCLDLVSFPVLSQIKPQAPLLVVPFRQFLYGYPSCSHQEARLYLKQLSVTNIKSYPPTFSLWTASMQSIDRSIV